MAGIRKALPARTALAAAILLAGLAQPPLAWGQAAGQGVGVPNSAGRDAPASVPAPAGSPALRPPADTIQPGTTGAQIAHPPHRPADPQPDERAAGQGERRAQPNAPQR